MIISSQNSALEVAEVFFTSDDGCWLPIRGCTTTHASRKGSEKFLGRVLTSSEGGFSEGFLERGLLWGLAVKKGAGKGSQKRFLEGGFQKVPRTPPQRVRPLRREPDSCPHHQHQHDVIRARVLSPKRPRITHAWRQALGEAAEDPKYLTSGMLTMGDRILPTSPWFQTNLVGSYMGLCYRREILVKAISKVPDQNTLPKSFANY